MTDLKKLAQDVAYRTVMAGSEDNLVQLIYTALERVQKETLLAKIEWPSDAETFERFKSDWQNYPSQDNEGYVPDRGGFKAGFYSCFFWLRDNIKLAQEEK